MSGLEAQRVWVIAKGYTPDEGGMQTYARSVAEAYAAMGAIVTVFTQTSLGPRAGMIGPVQVIDIGSGKSPMVPVRLIRAMRREMRRHGPPALLHATTWRTSVPPMLMGLPYVTSFHGREFMYARGPTLAVMRRVARKARRVVAVSHFSGEALIRRIPGLARAPVIAWNGVTAGLERSDQPTDGGTVPHILTLCRLEPRKNIGTAVEAAAICHNEGRRFRFTLAGRGPELGAIRTQIARHGLDALIHVAGFVDQDHAVALYRDADIFLHPQIITDHGRDFEGFGIAIADAMYAGTAVIVGNEGGAAELVEDGVSGLVVDGHNPQAVADALKLLLDDPVLRHSMAVAAARRAGQEFCWNRHVRTILAALDPAGSQ